MAHDHNIEACHKSEQLDHLLSPCEELHGEASGDLEIDSGDEDTDSDSGDSYSREKRGVPETTPIDSPNVSRPAGGHKMISLLHTYRRTLNTNSIVGHVGHRKDCVVFTMPDLLLEKDAFVCDWDGYASTNRVVHVAVDNSSSPPSAQCTCAMFIGLGYVTPGGTERMQCVHCKMAVDDLLPIATGRSSGLDSKYANLARYPPHVCSIAPYSV